MQMAMKYVTHLCIICNDADLSRMDLIYVQAYEAVRQQVGQEGQKALRAEAVSFDSVTRGQCNIPIAGSLAATTFPDTTRECVMEAYRKQRDILISRLSGSALRYPRVVRIGVCPVEVERPRRRAPNPHQSERGIRRGSG